MIGLIDYGSGNLRSVCKALQREGADVRLVPDAAAFKGLDAVVLPGVGAFGDCARNLRSRKLWEPVEDWLQSGKPFLGICVGFQLLFDSSEESPEERGLGFFTGEVRRFESGPLKVPQIGWNTLSFTRRDALLWKGLPETPYVYFVHSYFPVPEDPSIITATATYGQSFAAAVQKKNVSAVQFHPEKSQEVGLGLLRNFIASIP